ncbi:S1 RNA-binding domain-containing protein [Actinoplanes sp. NEAU-A11]|uniref:S1 RNA-binding domain-containing protein n=1 Tax=Actinoplanes aureus TaxID=2792083 RepID=A0A931C3A1_9ACTN|nr:S1 RNA-binding domain-containing protein [Actinoplanes aureus]
MLLADSAVAELELATRLRSVALARRAGEALATAADRAGRLLGAEHSTTVLVGRTLTACRRLVGAADDENGDGREEGTVLAPPREVFGTEPGLVELWESVEASLRAAPAADGLPSEAALLLSRKQADFERAWAAIEKVKEDDGVVRGEVVEVVKGGLILDIGLRGFLPASLVEPRRVRDLRPYLGRELEVKVIELDKSRNNVILSRRAWLEQTRSEIRGELLHKLQSGQIRKGVVSSIVNFGAFVDLGGVDGLVHISELSWTPVRHPSEAVRVGQEVEVEVVGVDLGRERVSLSLKATQDDPWHRFARTHAIGQIVRGQVTRLAPFGAFIRVDDGIEGLAHVSELAGRRVELPEQVVRAGQELLVKVIDIDLERRRISLSLKQADEDYLAEEEYFDPALYGMPATYDDDGNYIYPEGFDPDTGEWMEGADEQRVAWEEQYARARELWEAHGRQVQTLHARPEPEAGALSVEESLQALRDRLADGRD